jgi:hypothetical protein
MKGLDSAELAVGAEVVRADDDRKQTRELRYAAVMDVKTLHIVDGDSTGGTLKMSGLAKAGDILVWREALYSGPVPAGLPLRQLSRLRSRYWTNGTSTTEFEKRDAALAKHERYVKISLWFGRKCTLCHLSLAQILSWFREQGVSPQGLWWVAIHGGELHPEQIAKAYAKRRPVSGKQMQLGERMWWAFRQPSPAALIRFLQADFGAMPGLRPALLWLLQEYPNLRNGLSRLESDLLREIHRRKIAKASQAVTPIISREPVGDTLLSDMLRNFVQAKHPLLEFAQPFAGKVQSWEFNGATLALTNVGRRVLAGRDDAVALNGIDRWIGGVHLHGKSVRWRWDGKAKSVIAAKC